MGTSTRESTGPIPEGIDRVLVLGCPGSGKTTFARELSRLTGLPAHHLDDYYWGPGWARTEPDCWVSRQQALVAEDRWIIEGNYLETASIRIPNAGLIVILDAPTMTCLTRIIVRALRIRFGHRQYLPARVRDGARPGERIAATKDFSWLIWKILRYNRDDARRLIDLTSTNTRATRVIVVPGPSGRDRASGYVGRAEDQLTIVPRDEALRFVVERISASRPDPAPPLQRHSP